MMAAMTVEWVEVGDNKNRQVMINIPKIDQMDGITRPLRYKEKYIVKLP